MLSIQWSGWGKQDPSQHMKINEKISVVFFLKQYGHDEKNVLRQHRVDSTIGKKGIENDKAAFKRLNLFIIWTEYTQIRYN